MKRIYLIVNGVFAVAILLLLIANWRYVAPPDDKAVGKLPQLIQPPPIAVARMMLTSQDTVRTAEQNIFTPGRGRQEENTGKKVTAVNRPTLLLLGICRIGDVSGAIIADKNAVRSSPSNLPPNPIPNRIPGRPGAPGPMPIAKLPQTAAKPARKASEGKRFFKVGEVVKDGFVLKEVKVDSVVLASGRDQMELKLQRSGRFGNNEPKAVVGAKPKNGKAAAVSQVQILQHYDTMMQNKQMR